MECRLETLSALDGKELALVLAGASCRTFGNSGYPGRKEGRRETADHDELDVAVAQRLERLLNLHQGRLRAIPRTCFNALTVRSNFFARSAGVNRSCSTSKVKSIP